MSTEGIRIRESRHRDGGPWLQVHPYCGHKGGRLVQDTPEDREAIKVEKLKIPFCALKIGNFRSFFIFSTLVASHREALKKCKAMIRNFKKKEPNKKKPRRKCFFKCRKNKVFKFRRKCLEKCRKRKRSRRRRKRRFKNN